MTIDSREQNLLNSSLWGIARGLSVHTLIYPLEVIKIRQQCLENSEKSIRIARHLFQQEGMGAFYKGLSSQLLKISLKQAWCWPMITTIPTFLQRFPMEDIYRQIFTGLSIATVDALITTPLEKIKILSALTGKTEISFRDGWRGLYTHWARLSVNWSAFLVAQKILRDHYHAKSDQPLTLPQLVKIGLQVALIVSIVAAPFDIANTLKQARNLSVSNLLSGAKIDKLYRGWPLNALSLAIHNIASIIVIDKLNKRTI